MELIFTSTQESRVVKCHRLDMTDISVEKSWQVGVKSLKGPEHLQNQAIFGKICATSVRSSGHFHIYSLQETS